MESRYKLDTYLHALRMILEELKQHPDNVDFADALLSPIIARQEAFLAKIDEVNLELSIRPHTAIMEYLLNQKFNDGNTGIYINNEALSAANTYIYGLSEDFGERYIKSLAESDPKYIYSLKELNRDYDFIVYIPVSVVDLSSASQNDKDYIASIMAYVNKYNISGKRYKLENYNL